MQNNSQTVSSSYNQGQRLAALAIGVASTLSVSPNVAIANVPTPQPNVNSWSIHSPVLPVHAMVQPGTQTGWQSSARGGAGQSAGHGNGSAHHSFASFFSNQSSSVRNSGVTTTVTNTSDVNLASTSQTFLASNIANFKTLTIDVGGVKEVVSLGSKLTGAELVCR